MNIYIFDLDDTIVKHKSLKIDYNDYKYDPEFLKLLEKCKCDKKYIFTNGTDGHAKLILNNMGISNVFDFIFSRTNNISMKPILSSYVYVQNKIIEILKKRTTLALKILKSKGYNIKDTAIVGGVAANKKINQSFQQLCKENSCRFIFPPQNMCGDNAAMIAWTCLQQYKINIKPDLNFKEDPRWSINKKIDL